jgi:hypothetical protein
MGVSPWRSVHSEPVDEHPAAGPAPPATGLQVSHVTLYRRHQSRQQSVDGPIAVAAPIGSPPIGVHVPGV